MSKSQFKKHFLTQAVLASTLFVTPLLYATNQPPGSNPGPVLTSAQLDNIVEVPGNSQIKGNNVNAVNLDSIGASVIVDPVNTFAGVNAILATGAGPAIAINVTGTGGIINIGGAGSGVTNDATTAGSDAIFVNNSNLTLTNSGTLQTFGNNTDSTIHFTLTGNDATINNLLGASIQNSNTVIVKSAMILSDANSAGLVINNAGFITGQGLTTSNQDTIQLNSGFTSITNLANGIIQQISGGLDIGNTINIKGAGINNIFNNANAQIINNGSGSAIVYNAATTGTLNNAGVISSNRPAILLNANIKAITNSGLIQSSAPAISSGVANVTVFGGVTNTGNIEGYNGIAIDFQTNLTQAEIFQKGGNIFGNILLASADSAGGSNVFTMSGGNVGGDVVGATVQGNNFVVSAGNVTGSLRGNGGPGQNSFRLSGGTIAGQVLLGANGDTVTLSGTMASDIVGGAGLDTFNVSGGGFDSLSGGGNSDVLNVLGTFTANGFITQVPFINVLSPAVFTANAPITNLGGLELITINNGATFIPNDLIAANTGLVINNGLLRIMDAPLFDFSTGSGIVQSTGTIKLDPTAVLTLNSGTAATGLNDIAGSILNVQIAGITVPSGPTTSGQIIVNSINPNVVNLQKNSFIQPQFSGFVPEGQSYIITTVNSGGTISDNSTILQPPSPTVRFSKSVTAVNSLLQTLQLTADRTPYSALASTDVTNGISGALDTLAQGNGPSNQNLLDLLSQLDHLTSPAEVEQAMESLAPFFNYGLVEGSYLGMNNVFSGLKLRVEELRSMHSRKLGQSYGDPAGSVGIWGKLLGANAELHERNGVPGFNVDAGGGVIGSDWGVNDCFTLGIAGSYIKANENDKNVTPKDASIQSWQGTAYGWFEFQYDLYLDAMIAFAHNQYKTNRIIAVNQINSAAQASFHGTQWGAMADLGWLAYTRPHYYVSPFGRVKVLHLSLEGFEENGAGDLNLSQSSSDMEEFMGGVGIKVGWLFPMNRCLWVPEVSALVGYDFENDAEQITANFVGGGPAFVTNGIKPARGIFDLTLGVNGHLGPHTIFSFKYDLEVRNSFVTNAGYVQYNYYWG